MNSTPARTTPQALSMKKITSSSGAVYDYNPATGGFYQPSPAAAPPEPLPELVQHRTLRDGTLKMLTLEATQACNLKCTYCQHAHGGAPGVRFRPTRHSLASPGARYRYDQTRILYRSDPGSLKR